MAQEPENFRFIVNGPGEFDYAFSHLRQQGVDFSFSDRIEGKVYDRISHCTIRGSKQFWPDEKLKELCNKDPDFKGKIGACWVMAFSSRLDPAFEIEVGFLTHCSYLRFFHALFSPKTRKGIVSFIETRDGDMTFFDV